MDGLDDVARYAKVDPTDFLGLVERFAQQAEDAWDRGNSIQSFPISNLESIAFLGMGSSGTAGDVCRVILRDSSELFMDTVRDYEVPNWIGPRTLVFAISHSGNTEETLAAFESSVKRGSRVIAMSRDGLLAERARQLDVPHLPVPKGYRARAALGHLVFPILQLCYRLGLRPTLAAEFSETVELLRQRTEQYGRRRNLSSNLAKKIAIELYGKTPLIISSGEMGRVAGYRWKCQVNENAKVPAFYNTFPELKHNEVVGWDAARDGKGFILVVLRHGFETPRLAEVIERTVRHMRRSVCSVMEYRASGRSRLSCLFDLMNLSDFVSTYLAIERGVDPMSVETIDRLKAGA